MHHSDLLRRLAAARADLLSQPSFEVAGQICGIRGQSAQVMGLSNHVRVGDQVALMGASATPIIGEVAGVQAGVANIQTFDPLHGLGVGNRAVPCVCRTIGWDGSLTRSAARWMGAARSCPENRAVRSRPCRRRLFNGHDWARASTWGCVPWICSRPVVRGSVWGFSRGPG
jgi:hypothetical protein